MKGLLKYLSPFAPDQSGAVAVFYELGGITVICDAGGCTGNICGFDEPRWFQSKSALFSAGLRDMDAILGRDDRLVEKLKDAASHLDASFAVLIGTPVPAVIATDFKALKRMASKRCEMPVLTVECTGTRLYDDGEEEAWLELFRTFAKPVQSQGKRILGVIGATPLSVSRLTVKEMLKERLTDEGYDEICCYGMGDGLAQIQAAGTAEKNLVLSPAGIRAAEYLKETFGTPYEVAYPLLSDALLEQCRELSGKKVLVIHQQTAANEIRRELLKGGAASVTVGTWFQLKKEYASDGDVHFEREETFAQYVAEHEFDVIIADGMLQRAIREYKGAFIQVPHFAVSGHFEEESDESRKE